MVNKEDITKEVINGLVNEGLRDHKDNVLDTQIKYEKYIISKLVWFQIM